PVPDDAEAQPDRIDLLSHYFPPSAPRGLSLTVTVMWQVRLRMRTPRPLARAWKRLSVGPPSTHTVLTRSSSTSAPSLCSALAMADSSALRRGLAAFLVENCSSSSARPTGMPRIWSATSRPFWGESRTYLSTALACMTPASLARARLAVARMRLERARGRELAELVADHVLGDDHRHVLAAVVHRDGQADEIGRDRG